MPIRLEQITQRCTGECERELPCTEEYFFPGGRTPSQLATICRDCADYGRKPVGLQPKVAKPMAAGYLYYTRTMLTEEEQALLPDSGRIVPVQRYVMSQHLGRPISSDEYVRHLNGDKTDNRITNLALGTAKENTRDHMSLLRENSRMHGVALEVLGILYGQRQSVIVPPDIGGEYDPGGYNASRV